MEAILQEEGAKIYVIFAHTDELAIGAIEAINATESLKSGEDVLVISVGGSKAALDAILTGSLNASVENSAAVGDLVVDVGDNLVAGQAVPNENYLETRVFDIQNVKDGYSDRLYCMQE